MHEPSLSPPEQTDLRQYRDVSRLAIVALLVGFLSPVALAHPLLWIVPLGGLVLATAALLTLARHGGEMTGHRMATWGLCLSLFFGGWGVGQVALRGWILQSQAHALAEHWLTLWQAGEFEQAHQLTIPSTDRQPEGTDLKRFYPSLNATPPVLDSFLVSSPNQWLKQMHEQEGDFQFRTTEYHTQDSPYEDNFVLLYDIRIPGEAEVTEHELRLHIVRKVYDGLGVVDWYVDDTSDPARQGL
jgi:hypothetical protein